MKDDLLPKGETLRRAIRWISEHRDDPGIRLADVVNEAGLRFDLSPLDQEYLWHTFLRSHDGDARPAGS